jgi:hypothetical protein
MEVMTFIPTLVAVRTANEAVFAEKTLKLIGENVLRDT